MKREIELLAPAGNTLSLHAAVQSGADAVYIGGPMFNARQSAQNFSIDRIKQEADYCHLYGVDLHIAVNTLMKEREIGRLLDYVYQLNDAGVDALIVQDLGAVELIKKACPELPIHASTQMTVTSYEGVRYLEDMGVDRVVLARELSADEISNIVQRANAEIEVFVHGAICMCYSGQCLMSSIIGGRSANRGRCAQPCRLLYTLTDNTSTNIEAYALSPKDMALIDELKTLKEIGVASLKIEGRLKRPEYVSAVTGIYRKYLDYPSKVSKEDYKELKDAFSRSGFTKGYFKAQLGADMMSHKTPGNVSGNVFSPDATERAKDGANIRKIPIYMSAELKKNEPLALTVYDEDGYSVSVSGAQIPEPAINRAMDSDRLKEQLMKLGNTPFATEHIDISVDDGITVPVKEINALRRDAVDKLISSRTRREGREKVLIDIKKENNKDKNTTPQLVAQCYSYDSYKACVDLGIDTVYINREMSKNADKNAVIKASPIYRYEDIKNESVLVSSPAAAYAYRGKKLYGDFRLNVYNSYTADIFSDFERVTISPELNLHEIREVINNTKAKTEVIGYGRLELMIMKNCPIKALSKCQNHRQIYSLKDRKGEQFPIICTSDCTPILLNSKPLFMADKMGDLLSLGADAIRLVFTVEDAQTVRRIVNAYKRALAGEKVENIFKENSFTRGHFYRGVE
ncbi:MAG: U32 family peptidase [Clostridia bacterium]|nr:U32 family peptidase [Clostridia bacterium]